MRICFVTLAAASRSDMFTYCTAHIHDELAHAERARERERVGFKVFHLFCVEWHGYACVCVCCAGDPTEGGRGRPCACVCELKRKLYGRERCGTGGGGWVRWFGGGLYYMQ